MKKAALAITALCLSVAAAAPALAALGGGAASVEADRAHMNGVMQSTAATGYSVREIASPDGMVVREYVADNGTVFGFSWRGPRSADLQQLLGPAYYSQYVQAANTTPQPSRRLRSIELPGLRVHSSVRYRAFYGRAWAPDLVPAGVSTDEIK